MSVVEEEEVVEQPVVAVVEEMPVLAVLSVPLVPYLQTGR